MSKHVYFIISRVLLNDAFSSLDYIATNSRSNECQSVLSSEM
jgi:hypothetical protein